MRLWEKDDFKIPELIDSWGGSVFLLCLHDVHQDVSDDASDGWYRNHSWDSDDLAPLAREFFLQCFMFPLLEQTLLTVVSPTIPIAF